MARGFLWTIGISALTVNDVSIILGIVIPVIMSSTTGLWILIKRNGERNDAMAAAFRDSVNTLAADFRADTKLLADQLHERISNQQHRFSEFQIWVAKHHPERSEVNQQIDSAVQPMIREMQTLREHVTTMNGNLTQFIQQQSNNTGNDR